MEKSEATKISSIVQSQDEPFKAVKNNAYDLFKLDVQEVKSKIDEVHERRELEESSPMSPYNK